ncbi:MAG: 50S ribosomal protein L25/general stress protein Ctc [Duodenibacillus sp.]|nr:50S ribosomal protein L25/general stress protein Ctc [Duodenibacillus sp.]
MKIIVTAREQQGTSASRRLRRENKVPGIVYGGNQPAVTVALDHKELYYNLQKESFHSSIHTMELNGKTELVVLRAFQLHPYKSQVLHADFQRVKDDVEVTMNVPLHFFGDENSPAVRLDKGFISHLVNSIEVSCLPKHLPEYIDVDLSNVTSQDTVRVSSLKLPEGVSAVDPEQPIATVTTLGGDEAPAEGAAAS